jgi:hypothetical protein
MCKSDHEAELIERHIQDRTDSYNRRQERVESRENIETLCTALTMLIARRKAGVYLDMEIHDLINKMDEALLIESRAFLNLANEMHEN